MNKKTKIQLAIAIVLITILLVLATKEAPIDERIPVEVIGRQEIEQVEAFDVELQRRAGAYYLAGTLINNSSIGATLVITDLVCGTEELKETYRETLAFNTVTEKIKNEETGKREKVKRNVPVEIPVGESIPFVKNLENFSAAQTSCTLEVNSWSKYEE